MEDDVHVALRLGVAALGGLAVGIEREWSGRGDEGAQRFAGVRTFLLLGLIGGIAALLQEHGQGWPGFALLLAAGGLAVVAYASRALRGHVDSTTEVAAILVMGAGFLAGLGVLGVASAVFALTALVLVEKSFLHGLVSRIPSETLAAGARFAVLALVVLPLLPQGPYGPEPGFRPRELWALVLLFSGLSFAGYLALRAVGAHRGYGVAGLFGGLVSSTAVTLTFSRHSRARPELGGALALGVMAANTVLFARVVALVGALNPALGRAALVYLLPAFLVGVVVIAVAYRRQGVAPAETEHPQSPLGLVAAIQMAALFQVVLYAIHYARELFGDAGLLVTAALLGLTDVDALTYSMVKMSQGDDELARMAARALAVGALSNTVLKLLIAASVGRGRFRGMVVLGLAVLGLAVAVGLVLF